MSKIAAAYIRRSSVSGDSPGDASREAQGEATRRLAAAFAPDAELAEYVDWGISGRKDDRPDYVRLKADITADRVCCVFAYSLSRLGRTARELDALFSLCELHDVQVITQADGTLTASSATGKFLRRILAELAELESELAKERIHAALDAKRSRGDVLGRPTWGFLHTKDANGRVVRVPDPDAAVSVARVLDAVRDAGTILGAVKLLNGRGIASPKGLAWGTSALTRIVKAHAPELLARRRAKGRPAGPAILAGLLRCHCKQMMTPNVARRQYYCYKSHREGVATHGKGNVREADVLPWIVGRAAVHTQAGDDAGRLDRARRRRDELTEQRERLGYAVVDGLLSRDKAAAKAAEIDTELTQITDDLATVATAAPMNLVPVDPADVAGYAWWYDSDDPALMGRVNAWLRSTMRHVVMSTEMLPVDVEWRD